MPCACRPARHTAPGRHAVESAATSPPSSRGERPRVPSYDYHAASSLAEAVSLLGQYGSDAHVMAGGTSLVLLINQGLVQPGHVVGLRGIGELRGIERTGDGGLRIGALATHRDVERSPLVREYSPALSQAFSLVATIRIRNQGTVGGNLAHAAPAQDPP